MANTAMGGFRWVKSRNGSVKQPNVEILPVANNYGTAICRGDALKRVNDGTVAVATAGNSVDFICDGIDQYYSGGVLIKGNRVPASTTFTPTTVGSQYETRVRCIPVRSGVFEVDCDTAVADIAAAQTLIGNNADHVATAGSATTGRSGHVLNTASGSGTGTATFRITEVSRRIDNDVASANWKALVIVNESNEPEMTATGV